VTLVIPKRSLKLGARLKLPKRSPLTKREAEHTESFEESLRASNAQLLDEVDGLKRARMFDRMTFIKKRLNQEIDGAYYSVVVFQTFEQRVAFFDALGIHGDTKFFDGARLAAELKIPLPSAIRWQTVAPDPKLAALAQPVVKK
jgi:hypothetical protein